MITILIIIAFCICLFLIAKDSKKKKQETEELKKVSSNDSNYSDTAPEQKSNNSAGINWRKVIKIVLIVIAVIWLFGFFRGMYESHEGASILSVSIIRSKMGPISGSGFMTYFKVFTDYSSRVRDLFTF